MIYGQRRFEGLGKKACMQPNEFYLIPEDVFRLGNSESPRRDNLHSTSMTALRG